MTTKEMTEACRLGRLTLALALLPVAHPMLAQDTRLDPVAVEGALETSPTVDGQTVDNEALRLLRPATSDTAGLLRDVPGLSINGAGGVSSLPAIRGLADDRLRIRVDGMDLIATCPNHMNPPLSYVDPSNIGTLKVFAGITPVSVGGDSIGGTIVVDTQPARFAAPGEAPITEGEAGTFYRSNNDAYGANLSATYADQTFTVNYSAAWSRADNYTAGDDFKTTTETGRAGRFLPLDEVGSTAYETQNHTLGLALKAAEDVFELKLGYQNMPEQLYPNQRMDLLDNEQRRANLSWLGAFDWGDLETRVYHETVDHYMNFGPDKRFWYGMLSQPPAAPAVGTPCAPAGSMACAAGMPMFSEGRTTGATVKAEIAFAAGGLLRVGGEYQRYRLDDYWTASGGMMRPGTFRNINDGERDRAALFAEWESQASADWLSLVGARYERVDTDAGEVQGYAALSGPPTFQLEDAAAFNAAEREKTDHNWDLTALLRYTHDANLDIEFGVARKVRSPNLYERYTWSTWVMPAVMNNLVGDGNGYVGDIDLRPEKAHTVAATFDWHAADRRWEFKATPYYTRVNDYIDALPLNPATFVDDRFNVLKYTNQSARLYGIDLSARMPLARNAWGEWGLNALINYTDGKNRDTGDDLYNIMPLNAKLTLTHELGGWRNAFEFVAVDGKDDVSRVRNEIETAGYTLVNLRASHSWSNLRVDLGVENLFDRFYELPTGGAYLGQGTTMQINAIPWGIAVPGTGRSVYVGLNLSF